MSDSTPAEISELSDELLAQAFGAHKGVLSGLRAEYAELGARISAIYGVYEQLQDEIASRRLKAMVTPDWAWLLSTNAGLVQHRARDAALSKFDLLSSGHIPETRQACVRIALKRSGENFERTLAGLQEILPVLLPVEGVKVLSILEEGLSSQGSYSMGVVDNGRVEIRECRYSCATKIHEAENLEAALRYVQEKLPYSD